jgi:hypothetical protein
VNIADDLPSVLGQWWDKVLAGFAPGLPVAVSPPVLGIIVAAALALTVPRATWRWFGLFVTVVHELGHAFAALMTGQIVKGIHLRFDHSGTMHSLGRSRAGAVWSGFWGYPAPAVVGAALVWAAFSGWASLALSLSALLLLATLLFVRNFHGAVIALACAAVAGMLVWYTPPGFAGHVTLVTGIALLAGSIRAWVNLASVHVRRRRDVGGSDAYILSRRTGIPSPVWLAGFAAVIAAAALSAAATMAAAFGG